MSSSTVAIFLPRNAPELPRGSVVLVEGPSGTAYQRQHSTGVWHSATRVATWSELQSRTDRPGAFPLIVVHDADRCKIVLPTSGGDDEVDTERSSEPRTLHGLAHEGQALRVQPPQ